ncbi:MAG: thioredoxin [Bacteroidetes bacterium]|nr:DUF255 domain-containing protein [Bacteroidia bacterium]PCH69062.1 MAG: thioredoxin [Bacteroidota bacterium]
MTTLANSNKGDAGLEGSTTEAKIDGEETQGVKWVTIEDAVKKNKETPKKIFIDVYTTWCGWCKKMEKTTFQDPQVVKYLNDHYYSVKLDAERKDTIMFNGKPHTFNAGYKSHELAVKMLDMRMSYPTTVYLDENNNRIGKRPGFLDASKLLMILTYYGENHHKEITFEKYQKTYAESHPEVAPGQQMKKK